MANQGAERTVLVQCEACRVVFEHPRPPQAEVRAFYDDPGLWTSSVDPERKPRSYVDEVEAKEPAFKDLARRIERFKSGGRLLDVGSGPGLLELALDSNRWDVVGVDLSQYIAEFGRRTLGTHVRNESFEAADLPEGQFDVIVMKYVLDHLEEPMQALVRARELLRRDGLLVIADLINIDSFCARYFGAGHRLIHPMHFTYFSPRTIRTHLRRLGFDVRRVEYPFLRTPYFSAATVGLFASRVVRRALTLVAKTGEVVPSPPFYGNMMDVFAVPR